MKKFISVGLGSLFLLFGCGGNKPGAPVPAKDTVQQTREVRENAEAGFAGFWTRFRAAALAGNYTELSRYTVFPLQTRGLMDNQPVITYSEGEFAALFKLFLQTSTGLNTDNFDETQADYIKANPTITFNTGKLPLMHDNKTAAVASMEFENTSAGWKLKFLYLTDEVYAKTGKTRAI